MTEKLQELIDSTVQQAEEILTAPIEDHGAPDGFVRRRVLASEIQSRLVQVQELLHHMIDGLAGSDELTRRRLQQLRKEFGLI